MARCALFSSLFTSLLLLSAPGHGDEEVRLLGGNQFFAGATVTREIDAGGLESGRIRWQIVTFGAVAAAGEGPGPSLEFLLPAATRHIPATLRLEFPGGRTADLPVEIIPRRIDRLEQILSGTQIGVVGAQGLFGRLQLKFETLTSPGAIRRSPAALLFLAPGKWDTRPLLTALLEKVRGGAVVIAFGPDDAPWALAGPAGEGFGTWGQGEPVATSKLREAMGNHREIHPGLLRECYPGKGKLVLCRLGLLEHLEEEPRAEAILLDLVEQALRPPPELLTPARILPPKAEAENWPWTAFGSGGGEGPVVAAALTPELEKLTKRGPGLLLMTPGTSSFRYQGRRIRGPGSADRSGFARFATRRGIRILSEKVWR